MIPGEGSIRKLGNTFEIRFEREFSQPVDDVWGDRRGGWVTRPDLLRAFDHLAKQ